MALLVRLAAAGDLPVVRDLVRAYAALPGVDVCAVNVDQELADLPGDHGGRGGIWVAEVDGAVVGCVLMRPEDGEAILRRLYVRDAARGTGAGQALVEAVLNHAAGAGFDRVILETRPEFMAAAVRMYDAMGFVVIDGPSTTAPDCQWMAFDVSQLVPPGAHHARGILER